MINVDEASVPGLRDAQSGMEILDYELVVQPGHNMPPIRGDGW